jgi:hypothetical protein
MIAIPGGRPPDWMTVIALMSTLDELQKHQVAVKPVIIKGSALVTKARDDLVDAFMESDYNRLFWIDDDMLWTPDDFIRLLCFSTQVDVVAATYPAKRDPPTYYIKVPGTAQDPLQVSELGLIEVQGVGLGFACMTRRVIEDVVRTKPTMYDQVREKTMASVFRCDTFEGNFRGEDMAFFSDIRDAGHKVWIDPTISLGHFGQKEYRGALSTALNLIPFEAPLKREN